MRWMPDGTQRLRDVMPAVRTMPDSDTCRHVIRFFRLMSFFGRVVFIVPLIVKRSAMRGGSGLWQEFLMVDAFEIF